MWQPWGQDPMAATFMGSVAHQARPGAAQLTLVRSRIGSASKATMPRHEFAGAEDVLDEQPCRGRAAKSVTSTRPRMPLKTRRVAPFEPLIAAPCGYVQIPGRDRRRESCGRRRGADRPYPARPGFHVPVAATAWFRVR